MQIELSKDEIELVLKSILAEIGLLNKLLHRGSIFQEDFKKDKKECNKLYDRLTNNLMDDQE